MPRLANWPYCLTLKCDWMGTHERRSVLTNPEDPMVEEGEAKLLNHLQLITWCLIAQLFCFCIVSKTSTNDQFTCIFNSQFVLLSSCWCHI